MRPVKEKISITLDWDLVDRLKVLAENDNRALSQYLNVVLREHVNKIGSNEKTR